MEVGMTQLIWPLQCGKQDAGTGLTSLKAKPVNAYDLNLGLS